VRLASGYAYSVKKDCANAFDMYSKILYTLVTFLRKEKGEKSIHIENEQQV